MGNKFMNKVWGMLGVESDDDYDYEDYDSTANNNIDDKGTSLTTTNNTKLLVCQECNK